MFARAALSPNVHLLVQLHHRGRAGGSKRLRSSRSIVGSFSKYKLAQGHDRDLLTVTQAREGKLCIEPERVSVQEAVEDAVNTMQVLAARKRIALDSDVSRHLPPAHADPTRLCQILIILLDNAVKFTPGRRHGADQRSYVEGKRPAPSAGRGLGMRRSENLYQVQGSQQPDTSQAGRTGLELGLHIAKDLVTRQGGTIQVDEAEGGGSVFSFTLPLYVADSCLGSKLENRHKEVQTMSECLNGSDLFYKKTGLEYAEFA